MYSQANAAVKRDVTVRDRIHRETKKHQSEDRDEINRLLFYFEVASQNRVKGKRAIDLALGGMGFILFCLAYPFIAMGIKLSSRGPVIFKQQRTGYQGKPFTCYKFRTMHIIDLRRIDGQPVVTQKGDKRIFWFGNMLRKLNLDELPQILNVMKGNMSLVGPRPYPVDECAHWNSTFPDFYVRYAVKPGVSGLAQVTGYRGGTLDVDHMRKRLDKDLAYVRKRSIWLDLKIIWTTVLQMLKLDTKAH